MIGPMDRKVESLTRELSKKCGGQGAAVVIGAGLNLIMTAAQQIPDKAVRVGLVMAFRNMADQLDQQNSEVRQ